MLDKKQRLSQSLASIFIPFGVFISILYLPLPVSFTSFFKWYSPFLFLLLFLLYAIIFQLRNSSGKLANLVLTMLLFALALSFMWTSGYSDNKILGGLLPYKDAYYYYNGARLILDGFQLPEYSVQAAGRPLFPGFLATLLLFTGKNLQLSLAILVGLMAYTSYLAGEKIRSAFGALPAALYMVFFFVYAQEQIGYTHTEVLGLIFGNLGLILFWRADEEKRLTHFFFAILVTMVAVSARAGAFFIFPLIALWAGWAFDNAKSFSWKIFGSTMIVVISSYLIVNTLYSKVLVEPGNYSFGNFAYMIYGQIHGGTGWHRAIEELGTRSPEVVMDSAIQFFKAHPISFLLGAAKSYRDFFIPGYGGIFSFDGSSVAWLDMLLWGGGLLLILIAAKFAATGKRKTINTLLLASFVGILLSIPFLPPIDGGKRFYASTMPFFFAFVVSGFRLKANHLISQKFDLEVPTFTLSGLMVVMTLIIPVIILLVAEEPAISPPACPANQVPYAVRLDPGSYIDLSSTKDTSCGALPTLCVDSFYSNGKERTVDFLFIEMVEQAKRADSSIRIFTANNLMPDGKFHFFIGNSSAFKKIPSRTLITGCATEIYLEELKSRPVLYRIDTILSP